jgi:hypothetical protein
VPVVNGMSYGVVKKTPGKSAKAMCPALGSLSGKPEKFSKKETLEKI